VQMLLGIFAAKGVLPLEFKPAYSVGELVTQHLDELEREAERKGGVLQALGDHFAKVYKVAMPLAGPLVADGCPGRGEDGSSVAYLRPATISTGRGCCQTKGTSSVLTADSIGYWLFARRLTRGFVPYAPVPHSASSSQRIEEAVGGADIRHAVRHHRGEIHPAGLEAPAQRSRHRVQRVDEVVRLRPADVDHPIGDR